MVHDFPDGIDGRLPLRFLIEPHDLEREPVLLAGDLQRQVEDHRTVLTARYAHNDVRELLEEPPDAVERRIIDVLTAVEFHFGHHEAAC